VRRREDFMRALHLVKTVDGATWALRQMAALRRLGIDVTVALPAADRGLAPAYARASVDVVAADLDFVPTRPWTLAAAVGRCRALVAEVRPDVIHSHFVSTTLVARLALGRAHPLPRIFQVPGPLHLEHPWVRRLDLATSGDRDHWIGSCHWTCDEYRRRGVAADRVFLSYYGIELDGADAKRRAAAARTTIADSAPRRGALRGELGIAPDVPLLGMVAYTYAPKRLRGDDRGIKGHEDFIDAFRLLQHVIPDARAVVVGGPWKDAERYDERLRRRARDTCGDALRFVGRRDDVPAVYADLDVAVHPSLSENCGAAVESLAAGCPTVATRVGGLPDVVVDGRTGWLVPPRDPEQLAAAMLAALADRDEARRRAEAGRVLVRELFDVECTAREIASIYDRIVVPAAVVTARRAVDDERGARCAAYDTGKRIIDVVGALAVLLVTLPLFALAAIAVRLTLGTPVIYRQARIGRGGRTFTLLKLRTMRPAAGVEPSPADDERRLTRIGRWLRATSLHELPQLWNVLRGEMSLVRPRPLLPQYLGRYSPEQARRHEVLPGVTGLVQVGGRNALSWDEKFQLDVWYVDHRSLGLDIRILSRTLRALIRRDCIAAPGYATMPEFLGDVPARADVPNAPARASVASAPACATGKTCATS
jgi:lipopolysaccharide/colanic/teichoic acid biosynthesis glycosyltransferase/glycosyltransferase involved in cell wall biosynthesis